MQPQIKCDCSLNSRELYSSPVKMIVKPVEISVTFHIDSLAQKAI